MSQRFYGWGLACLMSCGASVGASAAWAQGTVPGPATLSAPEPASAPVTLAEDATSYTLANGLLSLRIEKRSGAVISLLYHDQDLLRNGRVYWSKVGSAGIGPFTQTSVRTDPAKNGGERVEVSCRAPFDGKAEHFPVDVDLRYSLGRGESGFYAYAVWDHKPNYGAFSVEEARFLARLNPEIFDYMTIDADRRGTMPSPEDWVKGTTLNMKEVHRLVSGPFAGKAEHKYDYSAVLADTPAYGWSSTRQDVGFWFINPSFESIAGGPTKAELTGHLDVNAPGSPILLDMWLGSHYGGSSLQVAQGEAWKKVIGPFFVYCNAVPMQTAVGQEQIQRMLWQDALARAASETKSWPYRWLQDPDYPQENKRATVTGRVVLRDKVVPTAKATNVWVGLTAPAYPVPAVAGFEPSIDWQRDAKYYQFWARADAEGRFSIPHVRPGTYTLHAFGDGVLGEFARANVTVKAGKPLNLGQLVWTPQHFGRPVWEIGTPDRTAREFRHGDHFWQWGLYYKYPEEFPNDVNFTIGKSNPRTDWNYAQPPRVGRISAEGVAEKADLRSTPWTIRFEMPKATRGTATLRLAFCGSRLGTNVDVAVNGQRVGNTGQLPSTGVMHRDGIRGYWYERDVAFDASKLKPGTNTITLTLLPATDWPQGVMYDYVRLELDEKK